MMFAAGIGIRLLFFGVQEPVYYSFAEGWAVYAAAGQSLGIFSYNLGYLALGFLPILGERVWGAWEHAIDTEAVFATLN